MRKKDSITSNETEIRGTATEVGSFVGFAF